MPRGKSAIGTYFSARKGESSHRKSLTLQRFSIQIFWDRREHVPVGRSHPEQSANAMRLSQGDYMFLKKRTHSQKKVGWWLVPFRAGGELIFPPDDKVKKQPLFPLGFEPRTSRVLGERDDHYTTETHITLQFWGTQFLLRWIMKGFTATSYKRITKTNKQKTLLQIRPIKNT